MRGGGDHVGDALLGLLEKGALFSATLGELALAHVVDDIAAAAEVVVAVEVADGGGAVADVFEEVLEEGLASGEAVAVVVDAGGLGVAAGEEGGARGDAEGMLDVSVLYRDAAGSEGVEMGGTGVGVAVVGETGGLLLIGHEEDDVGTGHGRCLGG